MGECLQGYLQSSAPSWEACRLQRSCIMQLLLSDEHHPSAKNHPFAKDLPVPAVAPKRGVSKVSTLQIWMRALECWPQALYFICRSRGTSTLTGWAPWKSWMMTTSWGRRTRSISLSARRTGRRRMRGYFQLSPGAKVRLFQSFVVFIREVDVPRPCVWRVSHV